ncbi:hypothetical protein [Streptomyces sp. CB02959]|uniref:hypothetical protein n=1 Tax=Streptomyces sp. CB02959 TaxID=2020330 RepID=UPI000D1BCB41
MTGQRRVLPAARGFCARLERAITIVEKGARLCGPPVWVRHELVHNQYATDPSEKKGAAFVEETYQVPEGSMPGCEAPVTGQPPAATTRIAECSQNTHREGVIPHPMRKERRC